MELETACSVGENGTYHIDDLLKYETKTNGKGVGVVENGSLEAIVAVLLK